MVADEPGSDGARELVLRIHAGDVRAEAELVAVYGPGVLRMLQAITRDRWCAEDLTQETFVIVLPRLRRRGLDDPAAVGQFLRQTARNLLMASNRRKRVRARIETGDALLYEVVDPAPGQLTEVLRQEQLSLVRQTIASFRPDRYRELLYRFYIAEEDKALICADLGLSEIHFNRVLYRARRRFRTALERRRLLRKRSLAVP